MSSTPSQFAAKCTRVATVVPRVKRDANTQAARAIKPAWFAQARLTPASRIAGRKVSIRDDTSGTRNVTTIIRWQGPVHLVEGPTARHIIAARHLGTRGGIRAKTNRLSVGAGLNEAFGGTGANRGVFGKMRSTTTRRGVVRRRAGKRALTINGSLRAYAFHPGTRGRGFWKANKQAARTISTTVYRASAVPAILRQAGFGS